MRHSFHATQLFKQTKQRPKNSVNRNKNNPSTLKRKEAKPDWDVC
jgi:hypothetical protein